MDIGYTWIFWQGKICRQFRLLIWASFIGQFVHQIGVEGMGGGYRYFSQLRASFYQST